MVVSKVQYHKTLCLTKHHWDLHNEIKHRVYIILCFLKLKAELVRILWQQFNLIDIKQNITVNIYAFATLSGKTLLSEGSCGTFQLCFRTMTQMINLVSVAQNIPHYPVFRVLWVVKYSNIVNIARNHHHV